MYLLGSLWGRLAGVQGIAGVLEDLTGATRLVLLPTQTADKEQLGGAFSQRGFGLFGQDVTVPLLTLKHTGMISYHNAEGRDDKLGEDKESINLWSKVWFQ